MQLTKQTKNYLLKSRSISSNKKTQNPLSIYLLNRRLQQIPQKNNNDTIENNKKTIFVCIFNFSLKYDH